MLPCGGSKWMEESTLLEEAALEDLKAIEVPYCVAPDHGSQSTLFSLMGEQVGWVWVACLI